MLKITQIEPNILQLYVSYIKTFLSVLGIVFLFFLVLLFLTYKHLQVKANFSQNTFEAEEFSFFAGFKTQKFYLSDIQEIRSNVSSRKAGKSVSTYEQPSLEMKNGEYIFLLKKSRNVMYSSKLSQKFNQFLEYGQENTFSKRVIYLGTLSSIILFTLSLTLFVLLTITILVGDVKVILNKKTSIYKVTYFSPIYKNRKGNLDEIKNVVILNGAIPTPFFKQKQAGLYLDMGEQEPILLEPLGVYKEEELSQKLINFQQKAKQITSFLSLELQKKRNQ